MVVARLRWGDDAEMRRAAEAATNQQFRDGEEGNDDLHVFDLILAADVVYEDEAIEPLVATACSLLCRRPAARWILSFARRNVPVEGVIAEAERRGLACRRAGGFECQTSGESIFELRWADLEE